MDLTLKILRTCIEFCRGDEWLILTIKLNGGCRNCTGPSHIFVLQLFLWNYAWIPPINTWYLRFWRDLLRSGLVLCTEDIDISSGRPVVTITTVAYRGGGLGCSYPPRSEFRRPSKIVPNSTRLWKLLKIAEFITPTHQDVWKKGSKMLKLPMFAIVLH